MGEDPERIEREIERTRAKLGEDLDALEEKINPKKVAHRSVGRAKGKAAEVKDKVIEAAGTAKDKVASAAGDAKDKVTDAKDKVTGGDDEPATAAGYDPAGATTAGGPAGLGDKVAGLAGTAREKVTPLAATAKDKVGPLAATAKDKAATRVGLDPETADTREVATAVAGGAWQTLREQTRRNPVAVGAAAFVLGVLVGR